MNLSINAFLKTGTDLMKVMAGMAIMLLFVAATAAAAGWVFASVSGDSRMQSNQLAASGPQDK